MNARPCFSVRRRLALGIVVAAWATLFGGASLVGVIAWGEEPPMAVQAEPAKTAPTASTPPAANTPPAADKPDATAKPDPAAKPPAAEPRALTLEESLGPDHAAKMTKGLAIFKAEVRTILTQRCLECHSPETTEAEFNLADRDSLLKGGERGKAIVIGKPQQSLLYKLVAKLQAPHMPHDGTSLTDREIAALAAWIEHGAPYDESLTVPAEKPADWTEKVVAAEAKQHWSFRPLRAIAPPVVPAVAGQGPAPVSNPIDQFIAAKLAEKGLVANPLAAKAVLIRRAYFDLLGLPPSPAEVAEFVADTSPDAYEKLIDRLLASPHYGERYARHWLDLARFGESHGYEHDYDRPTAYHYRDFVIQAFNQDLPFDRFLSWQLAGDEFSPDDRLAMMATGFLAAGVHSTQITKNEVEKHRYDEMDDMLATVGTSMLGLTVGCARCHDHKYDAIPQRDYYRMLSTFTTTVRSEVELDFDPESYRKAKEEFDRAHAPLVAARTEYEQDELPKALAAWLATDDAKATHYPWRVLEFKDLKSAGGAKFEKQGDGSYRVTGKNPNQETWTLSTLSATPVIAAVRLEALADPSLVKHGPGRAQNGNFALTNFTLSIQRASGEVIAAKLVRPQATFSQQGLEVGHAVDDGPQSGWAVDPEFGKNHVAVFELAEPIMTDGPVTLTFTLEFKNNVHHAIGRPRLSIADVLPPMPLDARTAPATMVQILDIPAEQRTREQLEALRAWYQPFDPHWSALNQKVVDHLATAPKPDLKKVLVSTEGRPAIRLHTQGEDFLKETHFLKRGDVEQKVKVAPMSFLQVLMPTAESQGLWHEAVPAGGRTSYRRRAFANWLTDAKQGAGPLVARVFVNRLWQHHFGHGIVATPSDFGARGAAPTHPELLEYLAHDFVANGWQIKRLHKLMMTSHAYMQSAAFDPAKSQLDSENVLLWRRIPRRLEAEAIRDALLAVSGLLDPTPFGPGTLDANSRRRSIYLTVKRSKLIPMMQVFDAPDALSGVAERPTTTIAPQALYLMNNPQVRESAKATARRLLGEPSVTGVAEEKRDPALVAAAYRRLLAREPNWKELTVGLGFLEQQREGYADRTHENEILAVADYCQVLFCLNEFVYVE